MKALSHDHGIGTRTELLAVLWVRVLRDHILRFFSGAFLRSNRNGSVAFRAQASGSFCHIFDYNNGGPI